MKMQTLQYKTSLQAPAEQVYRAFTSSTALREWLCDAAQADPHPGGRLYLWWSHGYYACGEFLALVPAQKVVVSWQGRGEPAPTQVQVTLKAKGAATSLTLTHSQVGTGPKWRETVAAFENGWDTALENLHTVLETGQDLRWVRRPMLGISGGDDLSDELAAKLNVPVNRGLRLDAVLEGLGAQRAGLQKDDVIVKFGGKKISCFADLISALQAHAAGDKVTVIFYRSGEKQTVTVELSARPQPELPATPAGLAESARKMYAETDAELELALAGVSEEVAAHPPAPDEWSLKDTLAHLIISERGLQDWIADLATGEERWYDKWGGNLSARNQAVIAVYPTVPALLAELKRAEAETLALLAALPPEFAQHKNSYWRLGNNLPLFPVHVREHLGHIKTRLAAQRA